MAPFAVGWQAFFHHMNKLRLKEILNKCITKVQNPNRWQYQSNTISIFEKHWIFHNTRNETAEKVTILFFLGNDFITDYL